MRNVSIMVAVLGCILGGSGAVDAQVKVRVGVLLPLSGPFAAEGGLAHRMIEDVLKGQPQIDLVVHDDEGKLDMAVARGDRMVREDKVTAVIGPLTLGATTAVAPVFTAARIPVISLAAPSHERLTNLVERNPRLIMFAPIAGTQVDVGGDFLRQVGQRQVSFAYFNPGSADYAEELAGRLGRTAGQFQSTLKAPVGTSAEAARFIQQAREKPNTVVVGTVAEPLADQMATELRRANATTAAILFSPPRTQTKARVAAVLVLDAVKKGARTPDDFLKSIESTALFQKDVRALAVDWTVVTYAIPPDLMRRLKSTSGGTTSCSCNSKDGKICKQKNCPANQKCRTEEKESDCTVECV